MSLQIVKIKISWYAILDYDGFFLVLREKPKSWLLDYNNCYWTSDSQKATCFQSLKEVTECVEYLQKRD